MDRIEFVDKLQHALSGGLGSAMVAENVQYYREYIDVEIRKGRSEEEVEEATGYDHYFSPGESVDFGLCDEIVGFEKIMEKAE